MFVHVQEEYTRQGIPWSPIDFIHPPTHPPTHPPLWDMFVQVQEGYTSEGIPWSPTDVIDNAKTLSLS